MVISYYGLGFVKITSGETVVVFDPQGARFASNLALASSGKSDYTHADFLISGAGEYEHSGLYVRGIGVTNKSGKRNTIYVVTIEGVAVCHLGALDHINVGAENIEALGDVGILFIPVGGETLTASEASKLANEIEPNIVIPISGTQDWQKSIKTFLKEEGEEKAEFLDKLTIRRKELEEKEAEVVALKPTNTN